MNRIACGLAAAWMAVAGPGCGAGKAGDECVDQDQDGYGLNCAAGLDCDDGDGSLWDACPVTLAWEAPTTNVDGSALNDLAGYRMYWGTSAGSYPGSEDLGMTASCVETSPGVTTCTARLEGFPAGQHFFVATAYNLDGVESSYSNEASHLFE